ncbi:MAG TPA: SelB C-terminal domain-containing protein [Actinophytocola sp.]|uniref:SelB domain-containing protein n=1 Tax=Actinophytocola sp. TaxID=1872138 RepID=UPI002DF81109|nr:SelB C-terminal domain-containing protein [Actinophytocola sp.]
MSEARRALDTSRRVAVPLLELREHGRHPPSAGRPADRRRPLRHRAEREPLAARLSRQPSRTEASLAPTNRLRSCA